MKLGMQVGLNPGHIVLDGDPAPLPRKGAEPPNFRPIYVVAKRLDGLRCHLVLGPLMFVLYINDLPMYVKKLQIAVSLHMMLN